MKRDNVAYLAGGLAFGFVFGFGFFHTLAWRPELQMAAGGGASEAIARPAGPMAPTQTGPTAPAEGPPAGAAPMIAKINDLKRRLQSDPKDAVAAIELANIYHDVGMYPQAVGFYEQALAIRPDDPDVLTDLGICYQSMRDNDRALALFAQAQAIDPKHWQSLYNSIVVMAFQVGRLDEADAALRRLESIQPGMPQTAELVAAVAQERSRRAAGGP